MTGLDTNVIVRYVMQDDPRQAAQATQFVESLTPGSPGFVTQLAVVELTWVLDSAFELDRNQVAAVIGQLLRVAAIVVERADQVWKALRAYTAGNADFSDCLIQAVSADAGCGRTVTFDRRAARSAGMELIA